MTADRPAMGDIEPASLRRRGPCATIMLDKTMEVFDLDPAGCAAGVVHEDCRQVEADHDRAFRLPMPAALSPSGIFRTLLDGAMWPRSMPLWERCILMGSG